MKHEEIVTVIIDDEGSAKQTLTCHLNRLSFIHLAGIRPSVAEAIDLITRSLPDLILLDIRMPERDGADLVRKLDCLNFHTHIIFISEQKEYALEAFRCDAFDFILKPFAGQELAAALRRVFQHNLNQHKIFDLENLRLNHDKKIRFNNRSGFIMISKSDILYITADSNYTELHLKNGTQEALSLNIGEVQKSIPAAYFFRITRSVIINLEHLVRVNTKEKYCLLHRDGEPVKLSISANRLKHLDNFIR